MKTYVLILVEKCNGPFTEDCFYDAKNKGVYTSFDKAIGEAKRVRNIVFETRLENDEATSKYNIINNNVEHGKTFTHIGFTLKDENRHWYFKIEEYSLDSQIPEELIPY